MTISKKKRNKKKDYKKLIELILKLQKIKLRKTYFFLGKKIKFSKYSINNLHKESDLFFDWYLKFLLKKKKLNKIKKEIKT